jgi:CheY-like chemotaxis protein
MADRLRPELILLDIGMPRLNGYDTCRAIRTRPWSGSTSVVALTGWGQEADKERAREAGFDAHLVKPVESAALARLTASVPLRPAHPASHGRAPTRRNLDRSSRHSGG